jgi:hypothetical protein
MHGLVDAVTSSFPGKVVFGNPARIGFAATTKFDSCEGKVTL